jgi:hypothetical protein
VCDGEHEEEMPLDEVQAGNNFRVRYGEEHTSRWRERRHHYEMSLGMFVSFPGEEPPAGSVATIGDQRTT